jgi:hypothetical protein
MAIQKADEKVFIDRAEKILEDSYTAAELWTDHIRPWCTRTIGVAFFVLCVYQVRRFLFF